jgi:hypothetical protein
MELSPEFLILLPGLEGYEYYGWKVGRVYIFENPQRSNDLMWA